MNCDESSKVLKLINFYEILSNFIPWFNYYHGSLNPGMESWYNPTQHPKYIEDYSEYLYGLLYMACSYTYIMCYKY